MLKFLTYLSYTLVLVGAVNWGLVGVFNFDLVAFLFGEMSTITRAVYSLVGLSALVSVITTYMSCPNKD